MPVAHFKNLREDCHRARMLRKQSPLPERLLWNALCSLKKEIGLKFRRQQPLHPYIADFACMRIRLVIELDGPSHNTRKVYDAKREADLRMMGWSILRFTNDDVLSNLAGVVLTVMSKAQQLAHQADDEAPSPIPSRKGRGTDCAVGETGSRV